MKRPLIAIAALFTLTGCSPVIDHLMQIESVPNDRPRTTVTLTPNQLTYLATQPSAGSPNRPPTTSVPTPGTPNAAP